MNMKQFLIYSMACVLAATFLGSAAYAQESSDEAAASGSESSESVIPDLESAAASLPEGSAGMVVAFKGEVSASDASGASRPLRKEDVVRVGETVHTGPGGYVVIEFVDGAKATVRPDSQLKIDRYAYGTGDDGAVVNLIKGGLRAITGGIAKERPESYTVKSNVATLGVRGTEFSVRICETDCSADAERFAGYSQGLEGNGYNVTQVLQ